MCGICLVDLVEQAFVSCSLGAQMVAGALVGMALMQFIVSCTLSMLLRHVKRYAVLGKWNFPPKIKNEEKNNLTNDELTVVVFYGTDIF